MDLDTPTFLPHVGSCEPVVAGSRYKVLAPAPVDLKDQLLHRELTQSYIFASVLLCRCMFFCCAHLL